MADEPSPIAKPEHVRAVLPILSRMDSQRRPESVYDELSLIYEEMDGLQGWNREHINDAREEPVKYLEAARARVSEIGARAVNLIAFIDAVLEPPKPPAAPK